MPRKKIKRKYCIRCGNLVKRIRTSTNSNLNFCSGYCTHHYYLDLIQEIKRKEKEIIKLKKHREEIHLTR